MKTFYDYQEVARTRSFLLLALLSAAILITTIATGLVLTAWLFVPTFYLIRYFVPNPVGEHRVDYPSWVPEQILDRFPELQFFPWELCGFFFLVLTLATGTAIVIVTRNKVRQLWIAGGIGVADSLGGICVTAEGYRRDQRTQRAVNVVQEIAVAARVPTPHVYVLHNEPGINSFAVGLTEKDMVLGLTAGAIEHLNREQLQGVVGHEFAHIKNGDTVRNILLVGYLHGLMAQIIAAQSLLQQGIAMMVKSISHGGQGIFGIFVAVCGALLWPVGLIGLGCATAIKSAYSRQREYLADASGLEFVRNDQGIAGAMKRILAHKAGSRVVSPSCLALSHVFFARSCGGLLGFFDSHPPLRSRIQRMDRNWDGQLQFEDEHEVGDFNGIFEGTLSIAQQARTAECGRLDAAAVGESAELRIAKEVAMLVANYAGQIRQELPDNLWALTQDFPTAEAMLFALWAAGETSSPEDDKSLEPLADVCDTAEQVAQALKPHIDHYSLSERLMLFDAAINVIRQAAQQSKSDLHAFCNRAAIFLSEPDDGDLFRWAWRKCVAQVVAQVQEQPRPEPKYGDCLDMLPDCETLISALAWANDSEVMRSYALQRAGNVLHSELRLLPAEACGLSAIDAAIENLQYLAPKARRQLALAGSTSIETDSKLNDTEALLMRGICSGLGYPPTTILPGQPVKIG